MQLIIIFPLQHLSAVTYEQTYLIAEIFLFSQYTGSLELGVRLPRDETFIDFEIEYTWD